MFVVAGQVEVLDLDREGFPDPHTGGVDQAEQQSVAVAACGDRPKDRDDLAGRDRARSGNGQPRAVQPGHRVGGDDLRSVGPAHPGSQGCLVAGSGGGGLGGQGGQIRAQDLRSDFLGVPAKFRANAARSPR